MRFNSKFFTILGLVLLGIAVGLTAYGVHFLQTFTPPPEYPNCQMFSGNCGPLTMQANFFASALLASTGFGILSLGQAMYMRPRRRRALRPGEWKLHKK